MGTNDSRTLPFAPRPKPAQKPKAPEYDRLVSLLTDPKNPVYLLFAHVSPDGDTLGSTLGLYHALIAARRPVFLFCEDPIPPRFAFLPGIGAFAQTPSFLPTKTNFIAIAIDVSDRERLGDAAGFYDLAPVRACIDHHATNPGFAQFNCIDPDAAATAEVVFELIRRAKLPMPPETVTCLFTGISTDTGHFNFENTTPRTLRIAAELLEQGVDLPAITRRLYRENSLAHTRLKARATLGMRLYAGGAVVTMALSREDFAACGADDADAEAVIDIAINLHGVRAAALLRELNGKVKVSFRARAPYDVAKLALGFGGGGHPRASGTTLEGPLSRAEADVAKALEALVAEPSDG